MEDKKIVIGVDANVEGAKDKIRVLAESVRSISDSMVSSAVERGKSYEDATKFIEEEINALERANSQRSSRRSREAQSEYQRGEVNLDQYGEIVDAIKEERESNREQVAALKEFLAKFSESQYKEKESQFQGQIDEKSRLAAGGISSRDIYRDRKGDDNIQGVAQGVTRYGGAIINSRDIVSGGMDIAGTGGSQLMGVGGGAAIAGAAVVLGAMLGKAMWSAAKDFNKGALASQAITGEKVDYRDLLEFTNIGLDPTEAASRMGTLARSRRSGANLKETLKSQAMLERGIGLDMNAFNEIEKLSLLEGNTGLSNIQSSVAAMRAGGIVKGQDMSAVPDYLAVIARLSNEQVTRLGKVDVGINSKMVAAMANMDDTLKKSPEALGTMISSVYSGLTGSRSPQTEALQYSVLSKMRPGASMFELMEMKENPFSEKNQRYLPEYLKQLEKMSGGNKEMTMMNIMQQFGLSASMSRTLYEGWKGGNLENVMKQKFAGKEGIENLEGRAKDVVSDQEKLELEKNKMILDISKGVGAIVDVMTGKASEEEKTAFGFAMANNPLFPFWPAPHQK
jgi:hypothetical protein